MAYEAQQRTNAQSVLRLLAMGLNPQTEQPLPPQDIVHRADVIRALMVAIESLGPTGQVVAKSLCEESSRAGESWEQAEDEQLSDEFEQSFSLSRIAATHQRSKGSITSRLLRLGLVHH